MIDRLPKCLHTCLHCSHAVICEEYTAYTRKLVFDGCWKTDSIQLPVAREDCDKFEESPDRIKRKFWEKWNWKVYVDKDLVEQVRPEDGSGEVHEQESEQGPGEVHGQAGEQGHSGPEQLIQGSDQSCEQPIVHIKDLPQGPGSLKNAHSDGPDHDQKEGKENGEVAFVQASELLKECDKKEKKGKPDEAHGQPPKQRKNSTRALILQALTNNLTKLKDIAYFAAVDPSTAHYHLRNLIRQERVIKLSWGRYTFPDNPALKETGQFFEKFLKNSSQSIRVNTGYMELHPTEKNILVDILSKDNRYLQLSERELARRNNISRYKVKKYTYKLEKKRLITIKKEGKQLIFTPTQVAIEAFSAFLHSEKTGSKIDSSSSKVQPITSKNWSNTNEKGEVNEGDVLQDQFGPGVSEGPGGQQGMPSAPDSSENEYLTQATAPEDPGHPDTSSQNVLQTFEDYIAWQQKNAHRLIIQFKLLRCNHNRLKGTGWIFGKKSIHKHFTEAFIFKSKDPSKEIINVLPKNPFIFTSPFEFEDQIIRFVNEVIDRLKEYGITIDLSEPAEIRLEHVALEDNAFARKLIKKGLLYFKSKIKTVDSTGEVITYAIAIDKSKKLHIEFEGREAHHMAETVEAFVDDVVSGKIDRKELREMPHAIKGIKTEVKQEFEKIEEKLSSNIEKIHTTQAVLHDNQLEFSQNLVSHTKMVQTIGEAAESVNKAADTIREVTESLKECLQLFRKGMESLTSKNSDTVSGNSGGIE